MGSTKAGEESASQLHFRDNIFQGGFAFWFCNKYWWALEWIALSLSASTGVLLYSWNVSEDPGSDTQDCVWRWCLREWQENELFSVYAERDWLASSDIIWKVQRDYLDFCVLILSEMKICSEVTSCRSWLLLVTGRSLAHCQSWQPRGNLVSKWLSLKSTRNFITCHNF